MRGLPRVTMGITKTITRARAYVYGEVLRYPLVTLGDLRRFRGKAAKPARTPADAGTAP